MSETLVIDRWLADTIATALDGIEHGGVFSDVAPPGASLPFVVFSLADSADVYAVGSIRVMTDATYLVKAVGPEASYEQVGALADAIDDALHAASSLTDDGFIVWCHRERPLRYAEEAGDEQYRHLGGYYRIQAREE